MITEQTHARLISVITRWDMALARREAKHGRENIYRLGLLLEALERFERAVEAGAAPLAALSDHFSERLCDKLAVELEKGKDR